MDGYRQNAGDLVLGIVTDTVSNPVLAGVAVRHVSMRERSLQSPKEIHSAGDVRLLCNNTP